MNQYLLSTHIVDGEERRAPQSPAEMQRFMERVMALEADMDQKGVFVFGGALHDADAATVVQMDRADVVMTDGPFVESKEHIGGFYVINAGDLDEAVAWAGKDRARFG